MEEVGDRPYVVVFFNADADLPAIPDTTSMQELHTALDAKHRDRLKVSAWLAAIASTYREVLYSPGNNQGYGMHPQSSGVALWVPQRAVFW